MKIRWYGALLLSISLCAIAFIAAQATQYPAVIPLMQDRSWIKSDLAIFAIPGNGKLIETHLNAPGIKLLAQHADAHAMYANNYGFPFSPDRQYVLYAYDYLYHIPSGRDVHLPGNYSRFCPDSTKLLSGTSVYDIASGKVEDIPYDFAMANDNKTFLSDYTWSQDGSSAYTAVYHDHKIHFYKYTLASGALKAIDGIRSWKIPGSSPYIYTEDGKELAVYTPLCAHCWKEGSYISSKGDSASVDFDAMQQERESPLISLNYRLMRMFLPEHLSRQNGATYHLNLKKKDGTVLPVEEFVFKEGEGGVLLWVDGWTKDGNYLLYVLNNVLYVYGVNENKKAVVMNPNSFHGWLE